VVHEKYLDTIKSACDKYQDDSEVEGLLFNYVHFWGDYDHFQKAHGWYKREIRIIKNIPDVHSWRDAQSFRHMPKFDGVDYFAVKDTSKLKVALIDAEIFHYGWVRPPMTMKNKAGSGDEMGFDYGPMNVLGKFKETHPVLMKKQIARHDWKDQLVNVSRDPNRRLQKHERLKNRIHTWVEGVLYDHKKEIFGFENYTIVR
jgi:hypothetical protein